MASASAAGLRYVTDEQPGFGRIATRRGFRYVDAEGRAVRDGAVLDRIKRLVIPPAWRDVWIAPSAEAHLQATGRDARGRKQYRYHTRWREIRDVTKYGRLLAFAHSLRGIRRQTLLDLGRPGLPRDKVLAAVVQLLEKTLIRVGNEEYARANRSYGLTTLRDRHVAIVGADVRFEFRGKSGLVRKVALHDARLAKVVRRCQDLPGQELFQYEDETGARVRVGSADVNAYLREITTEDFTAKDFRTWAGTLLVACALREIAVAATATAAKRNIVRAIECAADRLGNTKAVCRKSYVHPAVLEAYSAGELISPVTPTSAGRRVATRLAHLSPDEAGLLAFLERHQPGRQPRARTRRRHE